MAIKAEFRNSAEHPDHWEIWHSHDGGTTWKFDRLEEKRVEPTDEQLENLTLTLGLPTLPKDFRPPEWRQSMLNLRNIVQKSMNGDHDATVALGAILATFKN